MKRRDVVQCAVRELVGESLSTTRKKLGFTQTFVADAMAIAGYAWSRDVVAKIESGKRRFLVDELVVLLTVLPFDLADILPEPVGDAYKR
jgi:transcriptional regulator with XRE-family HTH domain